MAFRQKDSEDEISPKRLSPSSEKLIFRSRKVSTSTGAVSVVKEADFLPVIRERSRSPVRQIRRGEQGKSLDEIQKMEKAGFVMSGSRNARLNLLREQQAAEAEKNNVAKRLEQQAKKEDLIVDHFRQLLIQRQSRGSSDT